MLLCMAGPLTTCVPAGIVTLPVRPTRLIALWGAFPVRRGKTRVSVFSACAHEGLEALPVRLKPIALRSAPPVSSYGRHVHSGRHKYCI